MIRIGFWGPFYFYYHKEPPNLILWSVARKEISAGKKGIDYESFCKHVRKACRANPQQSCEVSKVRPQAKTDKTPRSWLASVS